MTGLRNILWACVAVVALGSPAFAQGGGASSTGSISGEIKDAQGGVLPGVTVTATSPAQIGTLSAVTNEAGIYRFPSVPPGEYRLSYELAGFQTTVREGIRITLGFNAQVNVAMNVASLQETVTVSGESPVIDTSATRVQTNYDQQMLSSIPNARDMWSLLSTTPSVTLNRIDVGGATAGTQTTYFAYGYSGQNRPLIEGINTTEGTAAAGFYLDYGSFEEVFIGAAGNTAEMNTPGVLTQFVGKSGGNRPSVSLYYDYENEDIQGSNLADDQITPSPGASIRPDGNRLSEYKNLNLGVGGPVIRDRMWGHFSYLNQQTSVAAPAGGSFLDGTPFNTKLYNYTGKLTYQVNQANKLIGYLQHGTKEQPNRTDSATNARIASPVHITVASTVLQASPSWVYKGEWNGTLNQSTFVEIRGGQFGYNFGLDSNNNDTRYESLTSREVLGGGRDWELRRRRNQFTGALSYFKDRFAGGSHNIKFGGEYMDEKGQTLWNWYYKDNVVHYVNGSLQGPLSATTPVEVRLTTNGNSWSALGTQSAFVTDTWTIDKLTLNIGARFDRYRVYLPEQSVAAGRFVPQAVSYPANDSIKTFNHIVPRFGATYDLAGDGKTVLKASWGRFYFNPGITLADAVNVNTANQYADHVWNDLNGDRVFQEGEAGTQVARFGGTAGAAIDPDIRNSYGDETSFFIERALITDLGVRAGFVYKTDRDGWQQVNASRPYSNFNIPTTVVDPGPDGLYSTSDDANVAAFNLSDTTTPANNITRNIDGYENNFKTLEFAVNKRYSNRYSLNASFSHTWTHQFGNLYFNNRFGTAVANFSLFGSYPSNPNEKTENEYTDWNAKITSTIDAGWGLRVTPVLKMQSGAPYGRFFQTRVGELNYGTQIILAEPIGTRRQDNVVVLDFRVEKQLRFAADRAKLGLFFDLFNATNSNTAVNIDWRSGAGFEKATTVLGPRIAKFGVKFDW